MSITSAIILPTNRHLLIFPHNLQLKEGYEENELGIILPQDYKEGPPRHTVVTILDVAPDVASVFRDYKKGTMQSVREAIVLFSMIEDFEYKGKKYYTILENHVVALVKGIE